MDSSPQNQSSETTIVVSVPGEPQAKLKPDVVALQNLCEAQKLEVTAARQELSEMKLHMQTMAKEFAVQMSVCAAYSGVHVDSNTTVCCYPFGVYVHDDYVKI